MMPMVRTWCALRRPSYDAADGLDPVAQYTSATQPYCGFVCMEQENCEKGAIGGTQVAPMPSAAASARGRGLPARMLLPVHAFSAETALPEPVPEVSEVIEDIEDIVIEDRLEDKFDDIDPKWAVKTLIQSGDIED
jgi:hypothetical protein